MKSAKRNTFLINSLPEGHNSVLAGSMSGSGEIYYEQGIGRTAAAPLLYESL